MTHTRNQQPPHGDRWLNEWEIAPRDGPAVFIVDTLAYDHSGTRRGRWLDPTREPDAVRADIEECIGTALTSAGDWAVIDQVGLGDLMIPEQLSIDALVRFSRNRQDPRR